MISKLEAVNMMLRVIGEDPVNSLASGLSDAESAESILDDVNRDIQSIGWHCNTEEKLKLIPTNENIITLSPTVLKIDSTYTSASRNVTKRGNQLYDKDDSTFTFTDPVWCKIVYLLDFEDITYALQRYIVSIAKKQFQQSAFGSGVIDEEIDEEVQTTYANLLDEEADNEDNNSLTDNPFTYITTYRNNPLNRA